MVYIASAPAQHLDGVRSALRAGKAVLFEKPLAASVARALALIESVAAAGLPFAVNFPFARSSAAMRLLQQRQGGHLGTLQQAHIRHIDAEVSGDLADHTRFAQVGSQASLALTDWYRLDEGGIVSGRPDPSPGTLDGLAQMQAGASNHRLATVEEAMAVVRVVQVVKAVVLARSVGLRVGADPT